MKYVYVCEQITPQRLKQHTSAYNKKALLYQTYERAKRPPISRAPSVSSNLGNGASWVPAPESVEFADISYVLSGWIVSPVEDGRLTGQRRNSEGCPAQLNII